MFIRIVRLLGLTGLFCILGTIELTKAAELSFDGVYKGPANSPNGGLCRNFTATMKVESGAFTIPYAANLTIAGTIAPGGAVTGQGSFFARDKMITSNMTGKISSGVANLTSDSPSCHYTFNLTKVP